MPDPTCIYIKEDGAQCQNISQVDSTYCPLHHRMINGVAAEVAADASDPKAVPEKYKKTYQDFLNGNATDLRGEQAMLRTLRVMLQDIQNAAAQDTKIQLVKDLKERITSYFLALRTDEIYPEGSSLSHAEQIVRAIYPDIEKVLPDFKFARTDFYLIRDLVKQTGEIAEKIKKIQEGFTLTVNIRTPVILQLVNRCILPFVRDPVILRQIIEAVRRFARDTSTYAETPAGTLAAPIDGNNAQLVPLEDVIKNAYREV